MLVSMTLRAALKVRGQIDLHGAHMRAQCRQFLRGLIPGTRANGRVEVMGAIDAMVLLFLVAVRILAASTMLYLAQPDLPSPLVNIAVNTCLAPLPATR